VAANAQAISELGGALYERLRTLSGYFTELRRGLDRAVDAYNKAVGSFEGRVLVSARRFKDLGVSTGEEIETLEVVDKSTRPIAEDNGETIPDIPAKAGKIRALPGGEEK
jgi:DNA recombination protein RmuC